MLASGLPEVVADDETLVRFIFQSNRFSTDRVKPSAFLPSSLSRNTSVFRVEANLDVILDTHANSQLSAQVLKAAAAVFARDVRMAELDVISEEPPLRHANIEHWYWDDNDPAEQRAKQLESALVVANSAQLIVVSVK